MNNSQSFILEDVTLIDGTGAEPRNRMGLRVEDGRITQIETVDRLDTSGNLPRLEYTGAVVHPGLIDTHVHLAGARGDEFDTYLLPREVQAMKAVGHAHQLLRYGFTSVRDISWNGLYLKRIIRHGALRGPRIIACGPGLTRRGGHADLPELPLRWLEEGHFWGIFADGPEEIRKAVRRLYREGADQIKFWATGGGNNEVDAMSERHYSDDEIRFIVAEAKMVKGGRTLAHAEEKSVIRACVEAGVDSIEHGEDLDEETAEMMARRGTFLIPTINLIANWYRDFMNPDFPVPPAVELGPFFQRDAWTEEDPDGDRKKALESFSLARQKGVPIAMGSDSVDEKVTPYGLYSAREMGCMTEFGMSPMETLVAATGTAAKVLDIDRYAGVLKEGMTADLVITRKNPLEDMSLFGDTGNILAVVQGGEPVFIEDRMVPPANG